MPALPCPRGEFCFRLAPATFARLPSSRARPFMANPKYMSMNGEIVPFADAKVHVLSPCVKYGAAVFEGIRGYWNAARKDMYLFRLAEHLDRLQFSMGVMRFAERIERRKISEALADLIK